MVDSMYKIQLSVWKIVFFFKSMIFEKKIIGKKEAL